MVALTSFTPVALPLQPCTSIQAAAGSSEWRRVESCCSSYSPKSSIWTSRLTSRASNLEELHLRRGGGSFALRVGVQQRRKVAVRSKSFGVQCAVQSVTEADFDAEVLQSSLPVLVDFWDTWCGPCKLVAPLMDWAAKEYDGKLRIVKIQADPNPNLVAEYKVYGLPTFIFFEGGKEVPGSHFEGAISKAKLKDYINDKLSALAR